MDNTKSFSPLIHVGYHKTATTFLQKHFLEPHSSFVPITDAEYRDNDRVASQSN